MNKEQFDKLFDDVNKKLIPQTKEEAYTCLEKYCDENGKLSIYDMASYLMIESRNYTSDLVYNLFLKLVVEP